MKRIMGAAVLALTAVWSGCTEITYGGPDWSGWDEWDGASLHVRGSGIPLTETHEVSGFDALIAWGVGSVIIRETGRERVTVTGDDNILPYLEIEVRDGVLRLGPEPGVGLTLRSQLVFEVDVIHLDDVNASGAVALEGSLGGQPELTVTLSGVTAFDASGDVDVLRVDASGTTRFGGSTLRSRHAIIEASGVSAVTVWATERLDASASGMASVRYRGDPVIHASVSGLASITGG